MTFGYNALFCFPPPKCIRTLTLHVKDRRSPAKLSRQSSYCHDRLSLSKTMSSFRNPFLRNSRILPRCLRRNYSSPPPTYPATNPIHVSPAILGQRSQLSTFLQVCLAGASIGLPAYWILWLGKKVSIPYCMSVVWGWESNCRCWTIGFISNKVDGGAETEVREYIPINGVGLTE